MGFVLGDIGRHEEARDGDASARSSSIRRCRARRRTSRSIATTAARYDELVPQRAGAPLARAARCRPRDSSRTTTSASPSGRRATTPRRCASISLALERGEDRDLVLQAMAEVHLLKQRRRGARSSSTTDLLARSTTARSSGTSAASRCTRTGASPRRERELPARARSSIRRTRSRTTTSAWRSIIAGDDRGGDRRRSAPRSTRSRRS